MALAPDARRVEPPRTPAHRIGSDAEALEAAQRLALLFREGEQARDRERRAPWDELDLLSQSGLLAMRVPRALGGAQVRHATVAEVVRRVSQADASLGQLFLSILLASSLIEAGGTPQQQAHFFGRMLAGWRWGNGNAEAGGRQSGVTHTRATRHGQGWRINGEKFYATGALYSHLISVGAIDEDGRGVTAVIHRHAPGLHIVDDWDGFGQRTTASGTLRLDNVEVDELHLLDSEKARANADGHSYGVPDLVHAAIDAGIARAAVEDTIQFVRDHARASKRAGIERAVEDPYVISYVGDLVTRLHAAEALLERGARRFDQASAGELPHAEAVVALAEAKIATTEVALLASNRLFQLGGTTTTRSAWGFDRHWRNARTHTVHDPVHWKYHTIGKHFLQGSPQELVRS